MKYGLDYLRKLTLLHSSLIHLCIGIIIHLLLISFKAIPPTYAALSLYFYLIEAQLDSLELC